MGGDRTVHAAYPGMEVVRYDRAGKWYLEPLDARPGRRAVTLHQAVDAAVYGLGITGGRWFRDRPGGSAFDRKVRAALGSRWEAS